MDKQIIKKLLAAANRAPSGDNIQPWRFTVNDDMNQIDLFKVIDKEAYFDHNSLATLTAHGAVIENIHIAAQALGLELKRSLFPASYNEDHVARFKLNATHSLHHPLYDAIFSRRTNRYRYNKKPINTDDMAILQAKASEDSNVTTSWVTSHTQIRKLSYSMQYNESIVFQNKTLHDFFRK